MHEASCPGGAARQAQGSIWHPDGEGVGEFRCLCTIVDPGSALRQGTELVEVLTNGFAGPSSLRSGSRVATLGGVASTGALGIFAPALTPLPDSEDFSGFQSRTVACRHPFGNILAVCRSTQVRWGLVR